MQQTSLNLLAISIFLITLSALLGPIIHISPTVPALATVTLLGLATVDTLGWQGRGMTIFLDWFSSFSPKHRQRIIHHEAGHFLVAYFLGVPVDGYTLSAWEAFKEGQPGLGGVQINSAPLLDNRNLNLMLERFCTVWMAGMAAETLVYGDAEGGLEDKEKMREALSVLGRPQQEFASKEQWAGLQAKNLIQRYWSAYEALVGAMAERATVQECCQVIQQHS